MFRSQKIFTKNSFDYLIKHKRRPQNNIKQFKRFKFLVHFDKITKDLPIEIRKTPHKENAMFATQDLNPGDVLFVERAFATLGEFNNAPHCLNCRLPENRIVLDKKLELLRSKGDDRIDTMLKRARSDLRSVERHGGGDNDSVDNSTTCEKCDARFCSDSCRDEAIVQSAHRLVECGAQAERVASNDVDSWQHPLNQLHRVWQRNDDPDAERALLSFRILWKVLAVNFNQHRFEKHLDLGVPLRAMCTDPHVSQQAVSSGGDEKDGDGGDNRVEPVRDSSSDKGRVDEQVTSAVHDALELVWRSRALQQANVAVTLDELTTVYARIASLARLNGFRLASNALQLSCEMPSDVSQLPADKDIDAKPIDVVKFSGLFTLASYMNHSCQPNVICVSTTLPSASASADLSTTRGDEFAFVAVANIAKGEEILFAYTLPMRHKSFEERRQYLYKRYGFHCMCPLCVKRV